MKCSWDLGKESKEETFTQGMVGKDYSRVYISEALLGGNMELYLKIKIVYSLYIYVWLVLLSVVTALM